MAGAGVGFARFAGHGISLSGLIKEVEFLASCFSEGPAVKSRRVRILLDLVEEIAEGLIKGASCSNGAATSRSSAVASLHLEHAL
jgi:hypothetical protein